ncbi:Fc.00g077600.m01.CDS01 [Cosmosporella sp. VM-42]
MFKSVRFAEPLVGPYQPAARLPTLASKFLVSEEKPTESLKRKLEVDETQTGNPVSEVALVGPVMAKKDGLLAGEVKLDTTCDERPLKRRLRPQKAKDPEPEVVITQVRPAGKSRKAPTKSALKKKAAPKNTAPKKISKKKAAPRKKVTEAPQQNAQAKPTHEEADGDNALGEASGAPIQTLDKDEL